MMQVENEPLASCFCFIFSIIIFYLCMSKKKAIGFIGSPGVDGTSIPSYGVNPRGVVGARTDEEGAVNPRGVVGARADEEGAEIKAPLNRKVPGLEGVCGT